MPQKGKKDFKQHATQRYNLSTPIGEMFIISCCNGLHSVSQIDDIVDKTFNPLKGCEVSLKNDPGSVHPPARECINWLRGYFENPSSVSVKNMPRICVAEEDGPFQQRVWLTLARNVGTGQMISYAALAQQAGSPGASQAVGTAMASNPIQILVPCHRVIRSDGTIGLYGRGCKNSVKSWLLQHEGINITTAMK